MSTAPRGATTTVAPSTQAVPRCGSNGYLNGGEQHVKLDLAESREPPSGGSA